MRILNAWKLNFHTAWCFDTSQQRHDIQHLYWILPPFDSFKLISCLCNAELKLNAIYNKLKVNLLIHLTLQKNITLTTESYFFCLVVLYKYLNILKAIIRYFWLVVRESIRNISVFFPCISFSFSFMSLFSHYA